MTRAIPIGGMWEFPGWEIQRDVEITDTCGGEPCPHCTDIRERTRQDYSKTLSWTERYWICSRVVVARNEGGCDTTGVCLDCILAAAENEPPR